MRSRRLQYLFLVTVSFTALVGCGVSPQAETKETQPTMSQAQSANAWQAGDTAVFLRRYQLALFLSGVQASVQPQRLADPTPTVSPPIATVAPESSPCGGGSYPPCYVAQRESGNTYTAFNPTGCGGNSCYGRWQFSGAWAGKLGLPLDLSTATPEQQDEAARILWNGGAGCSNWAACN